VLPVNGINRLGNCILHFSTSKCYNNSALDKADAICCQVQHFGIKTAVATRGRGLKNYSKPGLL
jgi:hypothetical protein